MIEKRWQLRVQLRAENQPAKRRLIVACDLKTSGVLQL
jgi:hypothetical protein